MQASRASGIVITARCVMAPEAQHETFSPGGATTIRIHGPLRPRIPAPDGLQTGGRRSHPPSMPAEHAALPERASQAAAARLLAGGSRRAPAPNHRPPRSSCGLKQLLGGCASPFLLAVRDRRNFPCGARAGRQRSKPRAGSPPRHACSGADCGRGGVRQNGGRSRRRRPTIPAPGSKLSRGHFPRAERNESLATQTRPAPTRIVLRARQGAE